MIQRLFKKVTDKIKWIRDYHWPRWVSRVQFYGLLYLGCKSIDLSPKSALIISPHQDDETLGCGGVIALKREQQVPVQVAFITDGAASHSWHPKFQNGELIPIRRQEALDALGILGLDPAEVHFLNHRDGKLKWIQAAERAEIVEKLAQIIQAFQPGEIYVTHRNDRSNDHEVAYELVQAAVAKTGLGLEVWQYPIWILWKPVLFRDLQPAELARARRLNVRSVQQKKRLALQAYRSQMQPIEGVGAALPKGFIWRFFLPYEIFFAPEPKP
jgi:N-acetylglucosamine malate deacetylase 1